MVTEVARRRGDRPNDNSKNNSMWRRAQAFAMDAAGNEHKNCGVVARKLPVNQEKKWYVFRENE